MDNKYCTVLITNQKQQRNSVRINDADQLINHILIYNIKTQLLCVCPDCIKLAIVAI